MAVFCDPDPDPDGRPDESAPPAKLKLARHDRGAA